MICRPCQIARMMPEEAEHIAKMLDTTLYPWQVCTLAGMWHRNCDRNGCECTHEVELKTDDVSELQEGRTAERGGIYQRCRKIARRMFRRSVPVPAPDRRRAP